MKLILHIVSAGTLLLCSCSGPGKPESAAAYRDSIPLTETTFNWPEGKYLYVNGGGMYFEEWAKGDSGIYKGTGFFINQASNDTLFSTTMRLQRKKEKTTLFYVVKGQSDNKDVEFMLTKEDGNVFVFENPFRDFPSIMQYKILGDTAIEVTERGFVNNHENVKVYTVKKID
ncbi:MAG: hypothetical protein ACXVPQ_04260 [Bacteroidia bacterium]